MARLPRETAAPHADAIVALLRDVHLDVRHAATRAAAVLGMQLQRCHLRAHNRLCWECRPCGSNQSAHMARAPRHGRTHLVSMHLRSLCLRTPAPARRLSADLRESASRYSCEIEASMRAAMVAEMEGSRGQRRQAPLWAAEALEHLAGAEATAAVYASQLEHPCEQVGTWCRVCRWAHGVA